METHEITAFVEDDGGRQAAGYKGYAGDCVTRAVAIATTLPYEQVRLELMEAHAHWIDTSRCRYATEKRAKGASRTVRNGVPKQVTRAYLADLGWKWTPTMGIGTGCRVHLRADELPAGRIICQVSKHLVAVIDGVIHDAHDPSRSGTRCVYGYWSKVGAA